MRIAAALLVLLACDSPGYRTHRGPIHLFRADAITMHDSLQSSCQIEGWVSPSLTSLPPWSGTASVTIYRVLATTHGVIASRQIAVSIPFTVTQDSTALVLTLGAPVDTTLTGSVIHAANDPITGTWTCPTSLPFVADSMLRSQGYDPDPPPSGNWSLRWMSPVD